MVLDTNVLLSGLMCPDGTPGRIIQAWRKARFELSLSIEQLAEVGLVLSYPKIRKILKWGHAAIERFVQQLYLRSALVEVANVAASVPRDPRDDFVLATLIASPAECLVTGDADLLVLRDRYPILTPTELVQRL